MSTKPLYRIPVGSKLVLDGCDWKVVGRSGDAYEVEGLETGELVSLSIQRVDDAIRAGQCEITTPAEAEQRRELLQYTGGYEHIHQLDKDEQKAIRARLALVLSMEQMEAEGLKLTQRFLDLRSTRKTLREHSRLIAGDEKIFGSERGGSILASMEIPKGRTLQKYRKLFERFGRNPVALLHREHLKGPQAEKRHKLCQLAEDFIAYVRDKWLSTVKPPLAPLYRLAQKAFDISAEAIAQGFVFPSITTLRTRINQLSKTLVTVGRVGERQSRNLKAAGATAVHALMFGEETQTDEVCLSISTDASGKRKINRLTQEQAKKQEPEKGEIFRTWLHLTIDVATRMPLAWILTETPDGDHGLELQRMASADKSRLAQKYGCTHQPAPPVGILISKGDNGTANRNSQVRTAQLGIGMTTLDGRTYTGPDKAHVESFFGTMQWDLLNFLPGYTGSRAGELPGYDPVKEAMLTPDDLYGVITRYLIDEYPHRPHRGTGMFGATPMAKMEDSIAFYGGIRAPNQRDRRLHLGLTSEISTTSEGVLVFGLPFNSTELQRYAGGASKLVTAHLDPDHPQIVSITAEGSDMEIEAHLTMSEFQDLTLDEIQDVILDVEISDPERRDRHVRIYGEALERRAMDSGFFPPSNTPDTYKRLEKLRRKADILAGIDVGRPLANGRMVSGGSVMHRVNATTSSPATASPKSAETAPATPVVPAAVTFTPIKESKL